MSGILNLDSLCDNKKVDATKNLANSDSIKNLNLDLLSDDISRCIQGLKTELSQLENIKNSIESTTIDELQKNLHFYQSFSESSFLSRKSLKIYEQDLTKFIDARRDVSKDIDIIGDSTFDVYASFDKENEQITMKIPEINGRFTEYEKSFQGDYLGAVTSKLLLSLIEKEKIDTPFFEKAVLVYEHHLDKNTNPNKQIDVDNLESKKITNAINGLLFPNDSLLQLSILHIGTLDDSAFTYLHIIKRERFYDWIIRNKNALEL